MALAATRALAHATPAFAIGEFQIELRLEPGKPVAAILKNFIGLGYEMSSAARPGLLSAQNAAYVQLIRNLGSEGVLRLGGIVADFTRYSANGTVIAEPKDTVVNRASLLQLRGFLDATNWTAIWSVNFGRGSVDEAVVEARDVAAVLGTRLLAIELGNEVENYSRGQTPLRQPPYDYETYRVEYSRWRSAILAANPKLHFAAPDTAASVEWLERMAADAHGEHDVQLLTTHYYRGNQKLGKPEQLTQPDAELKSNLERLHQAAIKSGIPWRMCETNSFYGGGRPGLSDTLTGALWTLDFMLLLAQSGCAGVNIETGVNQLGFISPYSPIQDDQAGHNTAGAPYYGMLAFSTAIADARNVLPLTIAQAPKEFTAYALGADDRLITLVLINKSSDQGTDVALRSLGLAHASAQRLIGPSLESKTGITFGGAGVDASGHWSATQPERLSASIIVPPASAVVIRSK